MKRTKRIFAIFMTLALAMSMLMAMTLTSFAAPENKKLTVPNETGHTYEVFQIFTGDLSDGKLSNVQWGQNGKGTGAVADSVLTALKNIQTSTADPAKVDAILSALGMAKTDLVDANAYKKDVAAGTVLEVPTGYYIVKDKDGSQANQNNAYSLLMIDVVGDVTLKAKMDTPEVVKKVVDVNDSTGATTGLQDSADYDIGDEVPYTLTATLANNVSAYKKYHITFVDELESGKFSAISGLTIKLNGQPIANGTGYNVSTAGYAGDVAPSTSGFTQTIEFTPAGEGNVFLPTSLNGATVTVEFTATLGPNAALGVPGNKNDVTLEYSNNPNDDQGGEEGTTPKDTVRVFTYQVTVNKIDPAKEGEDKSLTGADFTLYKEVVAGTEDAHLGSDIKSGLGANVKADALDNDKSYVVAGTKTGTTADSVFSFKGIDDGNYVLVETTIPAGYNAWDSVAFTVNATHDETADDPQLTSLTGGDLVSGEFKDTGVITTDIENKSGATLPSTGGIGTIIFYVLGSLLVVGCGIVLISKKRMESR